ncbi:MAG: class I SAM-dependent methyltransferase [Alphaproteobacteria bacterium]
MPNNLTEFLHSEIKNNGAMPLGCFMSHALCHPDFGYYTTRDPFGTKGDFTTAPEISQMFGEMIGAWVADIWAQMGRPPELSLIECGAGRGTLMSDIMHATKAVDGFHDAVQMHIIETSCVLRGSQKAALIQYDPKWHDSLDIGFVDNPCIIIGNEFLDALPVEQIRFTNGAWQQCFIAVDENSSDFGFVWLPLQKEIADIAPEVKKTHAIYEIAPERLRFMTLCAKLLKKNGGGMLFLDYGHKKSSDGETLQAIKNHQYTPVLKDVGNCDITAHVDFDTLIETAHEGGLATPPIVTQHDFLMGLGISHRAKILQNTALKKYGFEKGQEVAQSIEKDLDRLTSQKEMGTLFKVMCAYHGYNLQPAGFINE